MLHDRLAVYLLLIRLPDPSYNVTTPNAEIILTQFPGNRSLPSSSGYTYHTNDRWLRYRIRFTLALAASQLHRLFIHRHEI